MLSGECSLHSHEHCWLPLIYFLERYGHKGKDDIVNVEKTHIKMFSISLIRHYVDDKHRRLGKERKALTRCDVDTFSPILERPTKKMVRDYFLCALHVSNARNKNGNRLHLNISYFFKAKRTQREREV